MKPTYCLAIDIVGSTAASQTRSTAENDRFNRALVAHLGGYIRAASLGRTLIKFEGDGWLVMTTDVDLVPVLCCVALALRDNFKSQMACLLGGGGPGGVGPDVPDLRVALCCGLDSEVLLPTGLPDFVGDSARLATRAGKFCRPNEVLVDDSVRTVTSRDFALSEDVVADRAPAAGDAVRAQAPGRLFALLGLSDAGRGTRRLADLTDSLSRADLRGPLSPAPVRPPPEDLDAAAGGVDFDLVWGRVVGEPGRRFESIVTARHTNEVFVPPLALADETWRAAFWAFDDAASTGRQLYFKRLGRVRSWEATEDTLVLTLEHTFYAHFLATNLNLQLPPGGKPHPVLERIEDLVGADRLARQAFLASPLNVLAAVVSSDGTLFAPRRGDHLKERAGTLQTSVGGFWEWRDGPSPLQTLQREAVEELGLTVEPDEVEFAAFGLNGQTGEPDLLAVVHSRRSRDEIYKGWLARTKGNALTAEVSLDPRRLALEVNLTTADPETLARFVRKWRRGDEWSQPSDRASVLTALTRYVRPDVLREAFLSTAGRS